MAQILASESRPVQRVRADSSEPRVGIVSGPGCPNQALEACPCSQKAAHGAHVLMRSVLGGPEPEAPLKQKAAGFLRCLSSTSRPWAIPPMSHPVIPPRPNIAPEANEGAPLCRWTKEGPGWWTRRGDPAAGQAAHPSPLPRPDLRGLRLELQISGLLCPQTQGKSASGRVLADRQ